MKTILSFLGLLVLAAVAFLVYQLALQLGQNNRVPQKTQEVFTYLSRPTETDLEFVPVKRMVPKTEKLEELALVTLRALIQGPTAEETKEGLGVSFNEGTEVNYVKVSGNILFVDFNERFDTPMGGSLRVKAIYGSLEHTLRQFPLPNLTNLQLTINNGERQAVLEP